MDPVGKQKRIASNEHNVSIQKNIDAKASSRDGGFNTKSGTRSADTPRFDSKWQGKSKGGTKHQNFGD